MPLAPGSFSLYPHPQPKHLAFIFSTSRRAHGGTRAIHGSDPRGLCSFPPPRSREQNPGGSCPPPGPCASFPALQCAPGSACSTVRRLRVHPRTWISFETSGRQAASHSRRLGNSHTPQINSHLIAGGWGHSRLLLISLPANACRCQIAVPPLSQPSGRPRIMQLVPAHSSATWT